jgi:hypothetical protein
MRVFLLLILVAVGCAAKSDYYEPAMATAEYAEDNAAEAGRAPAGADGEAGEAIPADAAIERKIIYTAQVSLVVEDFEPVPDRVEQLVAQFDARIAGSNVSGRPGQPRRGTWTIRVPVDRYKEFLEAARDLGEIHNVNVDSQDVTAEYYDVDARIRNKQREEQRLLELLADATGKLHDILEVERELSRVRGEVEQMQGRLRVLTNQTSMSTVVLTVDEIKDYVPPPSEAPTYYTRVRRAFQSSIKSLVVAAQNVSIAAVALAPWLGVLLVLLIIIWLLVRVIRWRLRRRRS